MPQAFFQSGRFRVFTAAILRRIRRLMQAVPVERPDPVSEINGRIRDREGDWFLPRCYVTMPPKTGSMAVS